MSVTRSLRFYTMNMVDRPQDGELVLGYNRGGRPYIVKYHKEDDTFRVANPMNIVCWARVPDLLDVVLLGGLALRRDIDIAS